MKFVTYCIRALLAAIFLLAGIEKLFLPYNPSVFKANASMTDPQFFEFYNFLQDTGYLYFVGFFQGLCGLLLVFKRTYLLACIMLIPLILCLLMTHVFISKYSFYIVFDSVLLVLTFALISPHFTSLKILFLKRQSSLL